MEYQVTLDNFEGPLDLLLHLIKQSNIDIYDIKVDEITKQYLDYINAVSDLNIASEYLVMASELIELKSRMLLPKKDYEEELEDDPKEELINRLIEYQNYKNTIAEFKKLEDDRKNYYTKLPSDMKYYKIASDSLINDDINMDDLIEAFNKLLDRKVKEQPIPTTITKKEFLVSDRIKEIRNILKKKKQVEFTELFDNNNKDYIIVTFLGILNMAKKSELLIKQDHNFSKIFLSLRGV